MSFKLRILVVLLLLLLVGCESASTDSVGLEFVGYSAACSDGKMVITLEVFNAGEQELVVGYRKYGEVLSFSEEMRTEIWSGEITADRWVRLGAGWVFPEDYQLVPSGQAAEVVVLLDLPLTENRVGGLDHGLEWELLGAIPAVGPDYQPANLDYEIVFVVGHGLSSGFSEDNLRLAYSLSGRDVFDQRGTWQKLLYVKTGDKVIELCRD